MSAWQGLQQGDEIRIIAPSLSRTVNKNRRGFELAQRRMTNLGYKVTFGKNIDNQAHLGTGNAYDRLEDFMAAFSSKDIRAVMALNGGWSANELLPLIDWRIVRDNPKPFIGFSDNTVIVNAIYARTGLTALLGPNFYTIGEMTSWQYTLKNLNGLLTQRTPLQMQISREWSDRPDGVRKTKPWKVLQPGKAKARLVGGNLGTFYLLQGTPYQPQFDTPFILVVEDDDESGRLSGREFSRRLESILQLPDVRNNLKGILIGRFQPGSKFKESDLAEVIAAKQMTGIPVVSGLDFGHTIPMMTLPIGGGVELMACENSVDLTITSIT